MKKFLLIGLPGSGKTTTLKAWVTYLRSQGIPAHFVDTDSLINQRINAADPVIQRYQKQAGHSISPSIFTENNPSKAFIKAYGEAAMRNLEEMLLIDMLDSADENDWLDFGGRALLLPKVLAAVKAKNIVPIYLQAEHETIIQRLAKNEAWKLRPTYLLAAERSADGQGWKGNAEMHRKERMDIFNRIAEAIIPVEKKHLGRDKSPEEIIQEISLLLTVEQTSSLTPRF